MNTPVENTSGLVADDDCFSTLLAESYVADAVVAAHKEAIDNAKLTVSGRLLELAKACGDLETFLAFAKRAEKHIKAEREAASLPTKIPACWSQAKSNIKQGWSGGLDPRQFESESKFRQELNAKRKAARTSDSPQHVVEVDPGTVPAELRDMLNIFLSELGNADYDAARSALVEGILLLKAAKAQGKLASLPESQAEATSDTAAAGGAA